MGLLYELFRGILGVWTVAHIRPARFPGHAVAAFLDRKFYRVLSSADPLASEEMVPNLILVSEVAPLPTLRVWRWSVFEAKIHAE